MNTTPHPHPLHYHTWKDIGGPVGLVLDCAFCAFVVMSALGMIAVASFILLADYIFSPVYAIMSKCAFSRTK